MVKSKPAAGGEFWLEHFDDLDPDLPLPPEPTEHLAASPEKVAVIAWRIANGYQAWHPRDARGRHMGNSTDTPCITIAAGMFRVDTRRTDAEGVQRRFVKHFAIMDEALDWLDWLNEQYPVR